MQRYSVMNVTVEQVKQAGGIDIKTTSSTGIIFVTLTEEQAVYLRNLGAVVSEVQKIRTDVTPPAPVAAEPIYSPEQLVWAAGLEDMRGISAPPLYGEGFNLAIIDTGIRETHEKINGRVVYSKNFTASPMKDGFNHGSGVCSIALAVAPLCNILNLKVLDDKGEGTEEEAVLAIDDCISFLDTNPEIAPSVINLSLGSPDDGNPNNILRVVCRTAIDRGIWVIAATGNGGPNPGTILSPACEQYVAAIGSCGYEPFTISGFSSRGQTIEGLVKPDAVMFGENIIVASSENDIATTAKSGTSFSAPFASAMALLFHEGYQRKAVPTQQIAGVYPELGIWIPIEDTIDKYLQGICVKPQGSLTGKDNDYGYGLPFGPLVSQAITPTVNIFSMMAQVMPVLIFMSAIPVVMKEG